MLFVWFLLFRESLCYRVCLSAIVKDEEKVITRFLRNNLHAFDRFDITDTGSSDNTVSLANDYFVANNISGGVHHYAWNDDFGKAKTYALDKSKEQGCEHIVFLDADEEMWTSAMQPLRANDKETFFSDMDSYCPVVCNVQIYSNGFKWWRSFSISGSIRNSKFLGSRHEFIDSAGHGPTTFVNNYYIFARRDQTRHGREKNSLILDALALERDASRGLNLGRSLYYAGQSYEEAGEFDRALAMYRKRVACDEGWYQEKFVAQLHAGLIVEKTKGFVAAIPELFEAMKLDTTRAEPYFHLARGFRLDGNYIACFLLAREGACKKQSSEHLFAQEHIFTIGVHDEAAVCSSYLPQYRVDSLEYFIYLSKRLPDDERIKANLVWLNNTLTDAFQKSSLPNAAARSKLLKLWRQ